MADRKIIGGAAWPVWATNTRARMGGAAHPVALIDPATGDFAELLDSTAANALSKIMRDVVLEPVTLTVTKHSAGGVGIVNVAYDEFKANIGGDWYTVAAGNIDLNSADVLLPANVYGYVRLVGTSAVVEVSATDPEDNPAIGYNYAWLFVARFDSVGGTATIYFVRRAYTTADLFLHFAGEWDFYNEPLWIEGGNLTIDAADGTIDTTELEYRRLRFEGEIDAITNGKIILDSEAIVNNLELITTYADGSSVTAGKYIKLLLGALANVEADASYLVVRQSKPLVEYATLAEAKVDAENAAATSWPTEYRGAVSPLAYVVMLVGDASDLETVDLRATGATGSGGGGGGTTDHGALSGLGDDDHLQYLPLSGIRPMTGDLDMGLHDVKQVQEVDYNKNYAGPGAHVEGTVYWDKNENTLAAMTDVSGVILQIGQEFYVKARNNTAATIPNGTVVYITGAIGQRPTIAPADASNSAKVVILGMTTADIGINDNGYVTIAGIVRDLNTNAFTEGDTLYLSATTPGGLTNTMPAAPNFVVRVGYVTYANATQGKVLVRPDGQSAFGALVAGNYSQFEPDGTLRFVGNATVWRDFNFGVGALGVGASAPDLVSIAGTGLRLRAFDGNNITEQVYGSLEMDHDWKEGSTIYPHIHWMPTTANAGDVKWQLEYFWVPVGGTVTGSTVITATQSSTGTAWNMHFLNFPSISGGGKTIGSQMMVRLFRIPTDGADTYPDDAVVVTFGFHVELDTVGSRQIAAK